MSGFGRKQDRYSSLANGRAAKASALDGADPLALGEMILAVLSIGDAVLCGVTRDGGAVRVILMSGDEKTSQYCPSSEELRAFCTAVTQHVENMR